MLHTWLKKKEKKEEQAQKKKEKEEKQVEKQINSHLAQIKFLFEEVLSIDQ